MNICYTKFKMHEKLIRGITHAQEMKFIPKQAPTALDQIDETWHSKSEYRIVNDQYSQYATKN